MDSTVSWVKNPDSDCYSFLIENRDGNDIPLGTVGNAYMHSLHYRIIISFEDFQMPEKKC